MFRIMQILYRLLKSPTMDNQWLIGIPQQLKSSIRNILEHLVSIIPDISTGITLHSMRRGGCFYRVFESNHKRFNFRELMSWCRWHDAKTCCQYLITHSFSNQIDPRNLLRESNSNIVGQQHQNNPNLSHPIAMII
eukprot:NODE_736_length_4341_cov_0.251297.p4 type:complete len:136 gc:universal NODE_736_length_4341_cov_0.251297:1140-1547(+)